MSAAMTPKTCRLVALEDRLTVRPADPDGPWDLRSREVERYWLPIIGPSGIVLVRKLAEGLNAGPGFVTGAAMLSRACGLDGATARRSTLARTFDRLGRYGFIRWQVPGCELLVPTGVRMVSERLTREDRGYPAFLAVELAGLRNGRTGR